MARKTIKEKDKNLMRHHTGVTRFLGCQCFNDCYCREDFKPGRYDYYTVVRKNGKTTTHNDLEEANHRWDFINSL
jgi:hypothetical protein